MEQEKRKPGRPPKIKNESLIDAPHKKDKGVINPNFIMDEVLKLQMFQIRVDLNRWIAAINQAESVLLPDRTEMMQVYKDITLDAHLSGVMNSIKNKIKGKIFKIVDEKGNEDEKCLNIFEQEWFFNWIDYVVESIWYGYSLVQLGPVFNNTLKYVELIPRQYVVPEWEIVKKTLYITTRDAGTSFTEDKKYEPWLIMIDNKDLGILNKCVPHMIGKKNVTLYWWQFSEIFGSPFRKGKTDIRDSARRKNMENMLVNMGNAAWGVFDTDDDLEFVDNARTDAYKIYLEAINLANSEVSKLLAGQTMTFDNGSSRSQSEVHEDLFNDILSSFYRMIKFRTNNVLIPKMIKLGVKGLENKFFKYEFEEEVKFVDKVKTIHDITSVGYQFTPDFVDEYLDLGAKGKISIVPKMPNMLTGSSENAAKEIEQVKNMPWFTYLNKIDEMRNDKSKLEEYRKLYNNLK